jgi:hypothetical protein
MPTLNFDDTKGTCHLAYDASSGESYRFADGTVWNVVDSWATRMTGFKAILIQPDDAAKGVTVLSFAGTDSLLDVAVDIAQVCGEIPAQYHQALILTMQMKNSHGNLFLTGHSLGGGLAAYSSVSTRVSANTINPAPLVGGAGVRALFGNNNQITNFIAGGSELVSSSMGRNPGIDVTVSASGNFLTRHSLSNVVPGVALPQRI